MDTEANRSLVSVRLQMLLGLLGRKVSDNQLDNLRRVYCGALENFPQYAINKGFTKMEQVCQKLPTPKAMREYCAEFIYENWRYNFKPGQDQDPETGMAVNVLVDADPTCTRCRSAKSEHPNSRCKTYVASENGDDRVMYRPQDCPEGREFLLEMRRVAISATKR